MHCRDTDNELPTVKVPRVSTALAQRIDELLAAIEHCGGNGSITLGVSGGNVINTEMSTKSSFKDTKRGQRRPELKRVV